VQLENPGSVSHTSVQLEAPAGLQNELSLERGNQRHAGPDVDERLRRGAHLALTPVLPDEPENLERDLGQGRALA